MSTAPIFLKDCLVRFQTPRGPDPKTARVTPSSFHPTGQPHIEESAVTRTINDFHNFWGGNAALWLLGDAWSMVYAGVDKGPFDPRVMRPTAQPGLDHDDTVVSIILPSGKQKLDLVHANRNQLPGMHAEVAGYLFGITISNQSVSLDANDFVYTTSKVLKKAIEAARKRLPPPPPGPLQFPGETDHSWVLLELESPFGG